MSLEVILLAIGSIFPWGFYLIYTQPNTGREKRFFFIIFFALLLGWISTELVLRASAFIWPETEIKAKVAKSILSQTAFLAFVKAGMMEELCKSILIVSLSLILAFDWKKKEFLPETFLVGGFVALGFAGIENYHYILTAKEDDRIHTFILRTLKSSNAHLLINLCFALCLIKSNKRQFPDKYWYILSGFLLAVVQHGLFDFFVIPVGRFGHWAATALFVGIWVWIVKDRRVYMKEEKIYKEKPPQEKPLNEEVSQVVPEIIR
ncbi:PrsW family glutamic-type intramembrane protease [Leptospira dzoumogneensis]|uniref:PrsW family intramembrane metalloprotease n=1 Tax=Leptospira dzoumogneensis TaxID=2484904 RepID=A0A4Z1B367_9LEPT|nr:PrsW family glutamic-type intramembrane protease [Leptospira dzoumogneensis]TGN04164.1 PrsW family intramembrane metalloprotease [Leptospira dzoumogneensis]